MNQKLSKGIIVALLFSSLLLISSFTVAPVNAIVLSKVPLDAVQVWGVNQYDTTQWFDITTGDSAQDAGLNVTVIAGESPPQELVLNSTGAQDGAVDIYATGVNITGRTDVWFSTYYSVTNLTTNNNIRVMLGNHTVLSWDPTKLYAVATATEWYIQTDSSNETGVAPGTSGLLDVHIHLAEAPNGYVETYLGTSLINNETALSLADDDFNSVRVSASNGATVGFWNMGIYYEPVAPTPTPTPTPTPHSAGPGPLWSGSGSHSSTSDTSPAPVQQVSISLKGLADYSVLILAIALVVVVMIVIYVRKK